MDKSPGVTADLHCQPKAQGYEIRQYSLLPRPRSGNFAKFGITGLEGTSMSAAHAERNRGDRDRLAPCGRHPSPRRIARRLKSTAVDQAPRPGRVTATGSSTPRGRSARARLRHLTG
jgi:hypothetical protein